MKKIVVAQQPESYSKTGVVFRAYLEDGSPLYLGEETREALVTRILGLYPKAEITDKEPES